MHYLVTGGGGFIGSHVVERLLANDHRVTVIDNFTTGRRENLPEHSNLVTIGKDISACSPAEIEALEPPLDGILHLAAIASVADSWHDVVKVHDVNLTATLQVINWCKVASVPRLVFASSAAVYGNPVRVPTKEGDATHPLSPYGVQKLASEAYGTVFGRERGFAFIALRLFNVFGPRQLLNSPYTGVISKFTSALQSGRPIEIHGDGGQTRDFVSVYDVAWAFEAALHCEIKQGATAICNIGTGRAVSIGQLASELGRLFPNWKLNSITKARPGGDIQDSCAVITAATTLLGYSPKCTLQQGLLRLITATPKLPA